MDFVQSVVLLIVGAVVSQAVGAAVKHARRPFFPDWIARYEPGGRVVITRARKRRAYSVKLTVGDSEKRGIDSGMAQVEDHFDKGMSLVIENRDAAMFWMRWFDGQPLNLVAEVPTVDNREVRLRAPQKRPLFQIWIR